MVFLSETRTIASMTDGELSISDYVLFRCDSHNRQTGGVAVYVHNSIGANVVSCDCSDFIWSLSIKVNKGFAKDVFTVFYRGHDSNAANFYS